MTNKGIILKKMYILSGKEKVFLRPEEAQPLKAGEVCNRCRADGGRKGTIMDNYISEGSDTGVPFMELPLGFGMALAKSEPAMRGYAALSEAEKEQLILRCKDVKTKSEMQKIVDSLVPGEDVQAIYQEEKERFS